MRPWAARANPRGDAQLGKLTVFRSGIRPASAICNFVERDQIANYTPEHKTVKLQDR